MKKRWTQSLHVWSNSDHPFLPEDGQNRKNIFSAREKVQPLEVSKYLKIKAQPPIPFPGKTRLIFSIFVLDFEV